MNLVAVEGDVDTAADAHASEDVPPHGGGPKTISPVDQQTFAGINGRLIVTKGEDFILANCASCSAACYAGQLSDCSSFWMINGIPVCRNGDISQDGEHVFSGIIASHQNFVNTN
ncbi:hypothetical protein [Methanolacinia petrolearia]|uniref:hypothetical protein n=1 Tax=Methanolacinia petrolearia TaxID=54120 RepID=UPI003BA94234